MELRWRLRSRPTRMEIRSTVLRRATAEPPEQRNHLRTRVPRLRVHSVHLRMEQSRTLSTDQESRHAESQLPRLHRTKKTNLNFHGVRLPCRYWGQSVR